MFCDKQNFTPREISCKIKNEVIILEKELIKLKGSIDGVKIYLDAGGEISDIISSLYERLRQFRKFFGDGHCNIYFVGRELSASDKMRLEAVVSAMLPEGTVNYGDRKNPRGKKNIEQTLKLPDDIEKKAPPKEEDSGESSLKEIKDVVTTNFKSSRARFYEGTVRGGKTVESDGHLVLVGNVEEGGKVAAVGNIVVIGSVRGSVEAGCMGNDSAYIVALDFEPADVRIAKIHRVFDKNEFENNREELSRNNLPKKAYLINNQISIEDFLVKI